MGLLFFLCLSSVRGAGYAQEANQHTEIESHLNSELRKKSNQEDRKAGNKRHRSLTNQKSFRLIGSLTRGSSPSWQAFYQIVTQKFRCAWLTIAALAAITCSTVVHRAIFAVRLTSRLICRKSYRANHRGQNEKQSFSVMFHTRVNVRT